MLVSKLVEQAQSKYSVTIYSLQYLMAWGLAITTSWVTSANFMTCWNIKLNLRKLNIKNAVSINMLSILLSVSWLQWTEALCLIKRFASTIIIYYLSTLHHFTITQWINFPTIGVESTAIGREGAKSLSFCKMWDSCSGAWWLSLISEAWPFRTIGYFLHSSFIVETMWFLF